MKLNLMNDLTGHWKYQKTIYDLSKKNISNYKQCIDISSNDINHTFVIDQKVLSNDQTYSTITLDIDNLNKIYSYNTIAYKIKLKSNTQFNIIYKKKQISFQEKIYIINSNFFLIIGIMKRYNKYLSISFTSFIKIV